MNFSFSPSEHYMKWLGLMIETFLIIFLFHVIKFFQFVFFLLRVAVLLSFASFTEPLSVSICSYVCASVNYLSSGPGFFQLFCSSWSHENFIFLLSIMLNVCRLSLRQPLWVCFHWTYQWRPFCSHHLTKSFSFSDSNCL